MGHHAAPHLEVRLPGEGAVAMSGARHRVMGARIEREIVERHKALGIQAERYPLSGASHFRGSGHDIDVGAPGRDKTLVPPR